MKAHGGHNGSMHSGKHHPAGAKKTGSHYKSAEATVTTRGKRSGARSLNPSAMKKPKGA